MSAAVLPSPSSPLLRPPSRSFSNTTGNTVSGNPNVQATRPRGLSNRQPSYGSLKAQISNNSNTNAVSPGLNPPTSGDLNRNLSNYFPGDSGNVDGAAGDAGGPSAGASTGTVGSVGRASGRKRSSSIVSVQEVSETYDETLDREALVNINADWVNFKGAWVIHIILIVLGKVLVDIVPGMTQEKAWTFVVQAYCLITFVVFHCTTGTPFSANGGAFDRLTFWEQIDHGAQHTPARKYMTSLPILLFLLSTHYVRYDLHPNFFSANLFTVVVFGLAPKLPQFHRLRLRFFDSYELPSGVQVNVSDASAASSATSPSRKQQQADRRHRAMSPGGTTLLTGEALKGLGTGPPTPIAEESEPNTPRTPVDASTFGFRRRY